jgi:hypothetical protein
LIPLSKASLRIGRAFSSGMCHPSEFPKDMAPRTILEIFRPDLPRLR